VPAGTREDINRQIRGLALVAEDRFTVQELSTADGALVLTGRAR